MIVQVPVTTVVKATSSLADYGLLGIFTLLLITVLWYMEKQRSVTLTEMKATIAAQGAKIETMSTEHMNFIKNEYHRSTEITQSCLDVLTEVRDTLKEIKKNA